jgi:drug/metabolite transporter (DMT)-like permease
VSWLFYALLAPAMFTIAIFIDRYILDHEIDDYRGMVIYAALTALVLGAILVIATAFPVISLRDLALIIFTGIMGIWGVALYFWAMNVEETSAVIVLIQMIPLFVLILSSVFLGDTLTPRQLGGFFLILASAIAVSVRREEMKFRLSPALFAAVAASLLWAVQQVMFKFVVTETAFRDVVGYEALGFALGGLVLLAIPSIRHSFLSSLKTVRKRAVAIIFINEAWSTAAKLIAFLAISLGPVALVSVLEGSAVFFGIVVGWLLTVILPRLFSEDISPRALLRKGAFAAVMFSGLLLVR